MGIANRPAGPRFSAIAAGLLVAVGCTSRAPDLPGVRMVRGEGSGGRGGLLRPVPSSTLPQGDVVPQLSPGSLAASRVIAALQGVESSLRTTEYTHTTRVDPARGRYEWDCSAMAAWILARSAPRSVPPVASRRPLAVDFASVIERAPVQPARGAAWQRIARPGDARPGDVLAWRRPPWFPSRNTGHVAFVVGQRGAGPEGVYLRIADATSVGHEGDTRRGGSGFGYGTILVTTDPATGEGTGYGWGGHYSGPYIVPTRVVIGRPLR
jgi:hypothetical protein